MADRGGDKMPIGMIAGGCSRQYSASILGPRLADIQQQHHAAD